MKITSISDLHGYYPELPGGDLLIVAGDLTERDREVEYTWTFTNWLAEQEYAKKIVIAGNHDHYLYQNVNVGNQPFGGHAEYLCDSGTEFEGFKIWGSPWSLTFPGINPRCKAFTGSEILLAEKFAQIPRDTDILVTHGPPYDYLDHIKTYYDDKLPVGSISLYERIIDIYPKLHVFGHIHEGYGKEVRDFFPVWGRKTVTFINCSLVNENYEPVNDPVEIEI